MIKVGKRICNKLNKLIPCKTQEDIDKLTSMLEDILAHDDNDLYYNQLYLDREQISMLWLAMQHQCGTLDDNSTSY